MTSFNAGSSILIVLDKDFGPLTANINNFWLIIILSSCKCINFAQTVSFNFFTLSGMKNNVAYAPSFIKKQTENVLN